MFTEMELRSMYASLWVDNLTEMPLPRMDSNDRWPVFSMLVELGIIET